MSKKIIYVERKYWQRDSFAFSIENVFEQVGKNIRELGFEVDFQKIPFGNGFFEIIGNLIFFRRKKGDIFHITGQTHYMALVLPPDRTVLTIHDIGFIHTRSGLRGYLIKKLFFDWPVRRSKYITAVSEATKNEILANIKIDPQRIYVIENPLKDIFKPPFETIFNENCPTILQIGITPNKNIPNLLKALQGLSCKLRIIGKPDDLLMSELKKSSVKYDIAYGLSDEELILEYANADIVAFCSTYEGFGLPVIEAQAMRKPLITSNLSPLKEVAGKGALLVDPFDIEEIRKGLQQIIEDKNLRKNLVEEGSQNIKRFSPATIALKYNTLYTEMLW